MESHSATSQDIYPSEKSLTNYIQIGYFFATGGDLPPEARQVLGDVSSLDIAALVVDDIFDDSEVRAGRPCLFRTVGVKEAIVEAMLLQSRAVDALSEAMRLLDTPLSQQVQLYQRMNEYQTGMYTGQRLDLAARDDASFHPSLLDRYFRIIYLVTSCQMRIGMECGQLLAGRQPNADLGRTADAMGMIRQMCDDFNDYFDDYDNHEPFGDFKGGLNRLPELLFKRAGGEREEVLQVLREGRVGDARSLVLTQRVRQEIYEYCMAEKRKINDKATVDFDRLVRLVDDLDTILSH